MQLIDLKYEYGDVVYLATDEDQKPRIVTAVQIRGPLVTYELSNGAYSPTWVQECEISVTKFSMAAF